jgi:glycosyltransferase involved in cell wall biosynthesis
MSSAEHRAREKLRLLFVAFLPAAAGPQRFQRDLFAAEAFQAQIAAQLWCPKDIYRGILGKWRLLQDARQELQRHKPELVYLNHDLSLNVWLSLIFRLLGARRIAAYSNSSFYPMSAAKRALAQRLMRWLVDLPMGISAETARAMFGPGQAHCFPALIDFQRLRAEAWQSIERERAAFQFGCVGRFSAEKNQSLLIHAFALLRTRCLQAQIALPKLLLIGSGADQAMLAALIAATHSSACIELLPAQDNIAAWYRQHMDALLLPSIFEGQGRVVAEAQAFGLPVIASAGVPELAFLPDAPSTRGVPLTPEAWCDAMFALMTNMPDRVEPSLASLEQSHLSMQQGAQAIVELLQRSVANR